MPAMTAMMSTTRPGFFWISRRTRRQGGSWLSGMVRGMKSESSTGVAGRVAGRAARRGVADFSGGGRPRRSRR